MNLSQPSTATPDTRSILLGFADDELLTGHVLSAAAGWGPELEINIAMGSIGQDEIGHARRLYEFIESDRSAVERLVYERPASDFCASSLTRFRPVEWAEILTRQVLYDTADQYRRALLAECGGAIAAMVAEMEAEEAYHRDFWMAWWHATSRRPEGRVRIQLALDRLWPLACDSALGVSPGEYVDVLGIDPQRVESSLVTWRAEVAAACTDCGITIPDSDSGTISADDDALDEILDEMRAVYRTAPGQW